MTLHVRAPNEIRSEIAQLRIYRWATLYLLVIAAVTALSAVVSTTLVPDAYSVLSLTLWCGIPVVYLAVSAFLVIGLRDHFTRQIHARQVELRGLAQSDQEPAPVSPREAR